MCSNKALWQTKRPWWHPYHTHTSQCLAAFRPPATVRLCPPALVARSCDQTNGYRTRGVTCWTCLAGWPLEASRAFRTPSPWDWLSKSPSFPARTPRPSQKTWETNDTCNNALGNTLLCLTRRQVKQLGIPDYPKPPKPGRQKGGSLVQRSTLRLIFKKVAT